MAPTAEPPPKAGLARLSTDAWAALLPVVRRALDELPAGPDQPRRGRLRGTSTGRLAGGRGRQQLENLLSEDRELWDTVLPSLPPEVVTALAAQADDGVVSSGDRAQEQALIELRRRADRDRDRLRAVRQERDDARRRAEGAEQREAATREELAEVRARVAALEADLTAARGQLADAAVERERAVARERRRRDAELDELRTELRELRRADEERRAREAQERSASAAQHEPGRPTSEGAQPRRPGGLRPGRPSRLPEGVVPGTREAVELLLHRGRRLLVDGYNVTRQHRGELTLEQQRNWLVQALANLASARGVEPTVLFDGEVASGRRAGGAGRGVAVRFTADGITADDEIVFEVESTDDPLTVVTDDRELIQRVRASGADVIATHELLWLL